MGMGEGEKVDCMGKLESLVQTERGGKYGI